MNSSRKLKIWTLVTHGLILVGAGHGIAFLFVIEIITFPYFPKEGFTVSLDSKVNHFPLIGLVSLIGQVLMFWSIMATEKQLKNLFQILAVFALWIGILYFVYDSTNDSYIHIALPTVIPFSVCTILGFAGNFLTRFYKWLIN